MCGRFALTGIPLALARHFNLERPDLAARFNIAPTALAPVLLRDPDERQAPVFQNLFWGLVPFWAKDKSAAARMINARAETADEKPAFRAAFRHRRCLVPVSGFYEWRRDGSAKTPFYFSPSDPDAPLVLAGLWEEWSRDGELLRSFTILTTEANADMRPVHDRMPVALTPAAWDRWLDPDAQRRRDLADLLAAPPAGCLAARRVGPYVNKAGNDGPRCLEGA